HSPYSGKENLALQSVSVFFGGRLSDHMGALVKATHDNIYDTTSWDTLDVRYARTVSFGAHSAILGVDVNNSPTVQDLWSSLPVSSFPYVGSELVPGPGNAPIIHFQLSNRVLGGSIYSMIDNHVYAELGFYKGVSNKWLGNLGVGSGSSANIVGAAPYARI